MATYKDDLDILKAAEKADTNKLTFNAITELDNKGLLGRYGEERESGSIDLGITGASVGEYAKIKTVDADGVPTAWESGTSGGVFVVNAIIGETTVTLDKTYAEIKSAFMTGLVIIHQSVPDGNAMRLIARIYDDEEECAVYTFDPETSFMAELSCSSADDYPYTSLG